LLALTFPCIEYAGIFKDKLLGMNAQKVKFLKVVSGDRYSQGEAITAEVAAAARLLTQVSCNAFIPGLKMPR